ncbi:RND multidrug efflux transporter; Acriflavin resistance protein [hydrothermal vent metagenome]|uniref:RND multidrug efflux transporter Acriflavin resistance protein n=1 Tax=hydrothermal vent metagenome TaxID=652676 RepID=A0A3B1BZR2_9ZZZZ
MEALVRFSLKQRVLYNLLFVVLIVAGAFSMFSLPAERYPNVNFGEVTISTYFPGASPAEVETLVTREIEEALEGIKYIDWITATSFRERSYIRLKFTDDTDYETLYDEVRFNVLNMLGELPDGIDPPEINNTKIEDYLPVTVINLLGDHENRALVLMAEELKTVLRNIPGVQEVKFYGEYVREFHIKLDPQKLKALGVTFDVAAQALQNANISIPAGDFKNSSGEFTIKVDEKFRTREQVLSTIIRHDADGSFVRIGDIISHAGLGYRDPQIISSVNGETSLAIQIIKTTDGNALDIRQGIEQVVKQFRLSLQEQGVTLVITQDSTIAINDGISTLGMNMLLGITLVSLIIWFFMGFRNAGLITIGIPFSFMITMLIMHLTGNSLNELTLFAFVLVTGIIVDDAIVVTENIYRHIQEGKPLTEAIIVGTSEVALPVISATMTTAAAFLPMLIMTGTTGEFFALIPKVVTFAIFASLVECLFILPIHYLDFGPRPKAGKALHDMQENILMQALHRITQRLLKLTLRFRFSSLLLVLVAFIAAMAILGLSASGKSQLISIQFFPDDYTIYYVDIEASTNTPVEEIDAFTRAISNFIMADGSGMAGSAAGFAGYYVNEDYEPVFGNNFGTVMVTMPPKGEQTFDDPLQHLNQMRQRLIDKFGRDGLTLRVHPQKDGPPQGKDLNIRIVGSNIDAIDRLANELERFIQASPDIGAHLVNLEDNRGTPKRVFRFKVQQERASEYGLMPNQVAQLAASVLDGQYIGKYRLTDEEVDLKLYIDPRFMHEPEDALHIPLLEHPSGPIHLADLTQIQAYNEPGELNRYQGQRAISIKADLREGASTSIPAIIEQITQHYQKIQSRYAGATVTFGGEHDDTARSYTSLSYAFIIAVLIMYVILATQFQSYVQPLIVLSVIVFALIGVVFGKLVTQSLFTVNSFIAVLGVAGVVVNDALVLIDFINKRYRAGLSRRKAIEDGVRIRLRPIVLTTLTTTLGLLPMALGIPSYSLVWGTMASTFVTGLATSTALTLLIVPVLWDLVQGWQERRTRKKQASIQQW